ncbi:MAG TPA: alkaline phosphatase D family protein, partial [Chitinophagales bacterium]
MKRILFSFILVFSAVFAAFSQQLDGPERALLNPAYEPFYHGVASGDPLTDRVILWTRITNTNSFTDTVDWEIATDTAFANIVNSGTVVTDTSVDFTVKVDATNLQPNSWYFYRFKGHGRYSVMGRTKTAPTSGVDNLRFAVMSCAQMPNGFFHSYRDVVNRNDVDAVLFLGDYYYEYNSNSSVPGDTTRNSYPALQPITVADYRLRNSQYKLDEDLRECHRQFPWVMVWDDHEVANDGWMDGAQNHDSTTQGNFDLRKMASHKAYFEWMPIRDVVPNDDSLIHRTLHYGNLADVIMLDTRYEGRDKQVPGYLVNVKDSTLNDTTRTIMGATQRAWFLDQLNTSSATWKIIGNQVMIAPLIVFG